MWEEAVTFGENTDSRLTITVNPLRRLLKGILLLFIKPYTAGTRDSETYINPDITKVSIRVNGSPDKIYKNGIKAQDLWWEISRYF